MRYDKDLINTLTVEYLETDTDINNLLKELEKMCWKVLQRHPKYRDYWEDLKQEMLIKLWQFIADKSKLRKCVLGHVPADYFFFRCRGYALAVIPTIDSSFDPRHPYISKYSSKHPANRKLGDAELRAKRLDRPSSGYDSFDDDIIAYEELSASEKRKIFSEVNDEDYRQRNS